MKQILQAHQNIKHRTMLSLIYACGLRRGELLNLKLTDIDSKRGVLRVNQGKGAMDRVIPISENVLELLREYYKYEKPKESAIGSTINKKMQLPAPLPEAPRMFRCAKRGLIADIFKQAGLKNTSETEVNGKLNAGTTDIYWNLMTEVSAPFVAALSKTDDNMMAKIKSEVFDLVAQKFPDGNVLIDSSALVIYGEK